MTRLKPGDRVGNYLLDEQIGAGSFGEVFKAHHHVFNETVAIKIPTDPECVRHLQREGMAIHGLRHRNIVRALDLDPYGDPPYLVMEYVSGPSVRKLLEAQGGPLPLEAVVTILCGTLDALQVAHEAGVIHGDIKPANILVAGGDDLGSILVEGVKITDFGLGKVREAAVRTMMQSGSLTLEANKRISGTIAYMSPEQRDGGTVDERADLYSVGVVLHEMLTGVLPQGSDLPSSIRPGVPTWLDHLFERSYTGYERRFASAAEVREVVARHWAPARTADARGPVRPPQVRPVGEHWQCVSCQGYVNADDQFCLHCGHQLAADVPRCPSCHGFVGRADNYCILCGTDLRQEV